MVISHLQARLQRVIVPMKALVLGERSQGVSSASRKKRRLAWRFVAIPTNLLFVQRRQWVQTSRAASANDTGESACAE